MAEAALALSTASGGCLICGGRGVESFLDLGTTAYANRFLAADELGQAEPAAPLRVGFCPDCHHVQLTDLAPHRPCSRTISTSPRPPAR